MKKIMGLMLIIWFAFVLMACEMPEPSAEQKQENKTDLILNQMNNEIGMPNIKEFYEKKMAKEIYELRDNSKLVTYAYTQSMNGKFIYLGKAMGFGLPYGTQYTNPQKVEYSSLALPQADPNGLYMPDSATATWLMMINEENGKREIMYCEPNTVVTQSKLPKRLVEGWSLPNNY
jgi:hypothetical protein